jgi:transketolase
MDTMRERFYATAVELLDEDDRIAVVTAVIGAQEFVVSGAKRRHPNRVVDVGIREQLMIGTAAGLALEGFRPIAHSYTPFLIERPFEQIKLDFAHQDVGGILVSTGAAYDWPEGGRTHTAIGDVALLKTLPDWDIFVPGHPDEVETILRRASKTDRRTYVRMAAAQNDEPILEATEAVVAVRPAPRGTPLVLAVGPMLSNVLEATSGLDVAVAYTSAVQPLDAAGLRSLADTDVIVVEPYLAGTSATAVVAALDDRAIRLTSLGVGTAELRHYGTADDHEAAWGLDAAGLRRSISSALQRGHGGRYAAY